MQGIVAAVQRVTDTQRFFVNIQQDVSLVLLKYMYNIDLSSDSGAIHTALFIY